MVDNALRMLKLLLLCVLALPVLASCEYDKVNECITSIDLRNTPGQQALTLYPHNSNPVQIDGVSDSDIETEGKIMMGCESRIVRVEICTDPNLNCTDDTTGQNHTYYITDDQWKDVGISIADEDVIIINSVTGNWTVRESQGKRDCLLAPGVGDVNNCRAEQGRGLFIEMPDDKKFEMTTASGVTGENRRTLMGEELGGNGQVRMRFSQKKHGSTDEIVAVDPSNNKYAYETGGYDISLMICRDSSHSFTDGACLQQKNVNDGVAFVFDDVPGGACNGDGNYENNYGEYRVKLAYTSADDASALSKFLTVIVVAYKGFLFGPDNNGEGGVVSSIYEGLTGQEAFANVVKGAMALSIIFIGVGVTGGLIALKWEEFVKLVIKYGIVFTLVDPDGWSVVYKYIGVFFTDGVDDMLSGIAMIFTDMLQGTELPKIEVTSSSHLHTYAQGTTEAISLSTTERWLNVFEVANLPTEIFGNRNFWLKMSALLLSFPLGTFYFFVILVGVVIYFVTLAQLVFNYIVTLTLVALMLTLLPIAAIFWMFGKTSFVFEATLQHLFTYFLQILFTMTYLMFFSLLIYSVTYAMMMFTVCKNCALMIDWGLSEILFNIFGDFDIICMLWAYLPWGAGTMNDLWYRVGNFPVPFFRVAAFFILVFTFHSTTSWIIELSRRFGGAFNLAFNQAAATMQAFNTSISQSLGVGASAFDLSTYAATKTFTQSKRFAKNAHRPFTAFRDGYKGD